MGSLPTAVTSAEPLWIPFRVHAGQRVARDPRETRFEELRRLTTDGKAGPPVWDDSGATLRYVSPADCHAVVAVDLATGGVSQVRHETRLASLVGSDSHIPTGCKETRADANPSPRAIEPPSPVSLSGITNPDAWPTYAPDHAALAWQAPRQGSSNAAFDVFVAAPNGARPRAVTRDGLTNINPTFTHDGRQLVFASDRDATASGAALALYVVAPDGPGHANGGPLVLRVSWGTGDERAPRFSSDGRWLAFLSSRGGSGLDLYVARWRD